jgi:Cys-tRNA(Pro)/Cys-tRNA(Cys) deacylase
MAGKTIAARILDQQGIRYEVREYEVNADELDAISVAVKIGIAPEQTFKTLVVRGDKTGELVACVPAGAELDLKSLATISGNKKVDLVPVREIEGLTGYIRGGVSPLGMKKSYPLFIDELAEILDPISISGGRRGLQILLSGPDLIQVTKARRAPLTK